MATTKVLKAGRIIRTKDGYLYERKIVYNGSNWLHIRLPFTLEDGRVSITPKDGAEFMFKFSRPDMVYGIGGALKHIGKFADENVGTPNPVLSTPNPAEPSPELGEKKMSKYKALITDLLDKIYGKTAEEAVKIMKNRAKGQTAAQQTKNLQRSFRSSKEKP